MYFYLGPYLQGVQTFYFREFDRVVVPPPIGTELYVPSVTRNSNLYTNNRYLYKCSELSSMRFWYDWCFKKDGWFWLF